MRVLILGAGAHAQVVADILLRRQEYDSGVEPIGYLDDNIALRGRVFLGLPVLGGISQLSEISHDAIILGIGPNRTRKRLYEDLLARREQFARAIHPTAIIAPNSRIGAGTTICANAVVGVNATVGVNAIVNTASTVDHDNVVEDHAHLSAGVHLGGGAIIGEGALLGIGSTVMPGIRVGAWSTVGAASLALRDVPDGVTIVGVPGRILKPGSRGSSS